MSLLENLKNKLTEARRNKQGFEMSLLQTLIGDADLHRAKTGKDVNDDEMEKIIRKMIKGIDETIQLVKQDSSVLPKLKQEKTYVNTLAGEVLSQEQIKVYLQEIKNELVAAKSDGQATGLAVKYLKSKNLKALGNDVGVVVSSLRK